MRRGELVLEISRKLGSSTSLISPSHLSYDVPNSPYLDPAFEKKKLKQLSRGESHSMALSRSPVLLSE